MSPKFVAAALCATQLVTALLLHLFTESMRKRVRTRLQELSLQHATAAQRGRGAAAVPGGRPDTNKKSGTRCW